MDRNEHADEYADEHVNPGIADPDGRTWREQDPRVVLPGRRQQRQR
jgi:hypothetical protein